MEYFPEDYVVHNLPLVLLSGLEDDKQHLAKSDKSRALLSEDGFRITSDLPSLRSQKAQELLEQLVAQDASSRSWNAKQIASPELRSAFRVRSIGRTYILPPRKAPPPPHSPRLRPSNSNVTPPPAMVLHSMLSPLTPSSPLYADGLMTPLWVAKHQTRLPAIFAVFFSLSADTNTNTLLDNKIKSEVNNLRNVFASANYKTKVVVVLVGDEGLDAADVEDRLSNLRRAATSDSKSLFFVPFETSLTQVKDFVRTLLTTLYPISIEYYRDLSKHARRKRNRNAIPQPTVQPASGSSSVLPLQGWNVRYEFKLGVFAEFRQEMDAALRNYEAAYDSLFAPDVFEKIPSWSPRFNEARLLADIIVIRMIRCLLWNGQTTNAAGAWLKHQTRIRDLVARRGAGTDTYGWAAWQSTWSKTMADLIQRADILPSPSADDETLQKSILVHSEKTLNSIERFAPFESLHHEGYWLNLARQHTHVRRARALKMPEEDRVSPGRSPASAIANKAHMYDRYLTLEPHEEYPSDGSPGYDYTHHIIENLNQAVQHFSKHSQIRMIQMLQVKIALEQMQSALWREAAATLTALWQDPMFRKAGWWNLLSEIGRALWTCALKTDDNEILVQIGWELVHPLLDVGPDREAISLDRLDDSNSVRVALSTEERLSRLVPRFAFAAAEGHVGKPMDAQISIQHLVSADAAPICPVQIKVVFDGGLKPIYLVDVTAEKEASSNDTDITDVRLSDSRPGNLSKMKRLSMGAAESLSAEVDLSLASGQVKIYQIQMVPREAGEVSVASISVTLQNEFYERTITVAQADVAAQSWWESRGGKPLARLCGKQRDVAAARILPKPPKVEIEIPQLRKTYYTNEKIVLQFDLNNLEDEAVTGTLEARLISPSEHGAILNWDGSGDTPVENVKPSSTEYVQKLAPKQLTDLAVGSKAPIALVISDTEEAVDHELEVVFTYTLPSASETLLRKLLAIDLPVVRPFEANFGFHSRKHDAEWPSFFAADTTSQDSTVAIGLKQQYLVSALVCSFASEDIEIQSTQLVAHKIIGQAACSTSSGRLYEPNVAESVAVDEGNPMVIQPEQTSRFVFDMTTQKYVLGDRQPVAIDFLLNIIWKRPSSATPYTSTLQAPRFLAPSSEPRLLLQVLPRPDLQDPGDLPPHRSLPLYDLTYTIENPSLHFLTFNVTMETSEDFAFSGPKSKSISLVPISRYDLTYRLLPNQAKVEESAKSAANTRDREQTPKDRKSAWMKVNLDVIDAYFGQTLRVQAASDGIRVDKTGTVFIKL